MVLINKELTLTVPQVIFCTKQVSWINKPQIWHTEPRRPGDTSNIHACVSLLPFCELPVSSYNNATLSICQLLC
jgi:hypothetical protein